MNRPCSNAATVALTLLLGVGAAACHAQEVFSNGVSVAGSFVISNGFIQLGSIGYAQDDPETRHIAPSIGQMAGVEPDTGDPIDDNGDLLTLKPRILDLTNPTNLAFVIAAMQIAGSGTIQVDYAGSNIVLSIASGGITTNQLNLSSLDSRYLRRAGDSMAGDLDMNGNDLHDVGGIYASDGTLLLQAGSAALSRFVGQAAGRDSTGAETVGIGYYAAAWNSGSRVNALGMAARFNTATYVNAFGYSAGEWNSGGMLNALGYMAGDHNVGNDVNALGNRAAHQNSGSEVNTLGLYAGMNNSSSHLNGFGSYAGYANSGYIVQAFGPEAGYQNEGDYCFFAGDNAGKANTNSNVIAIGENISGNGLLPRTAYLDGDLRLMNCNGKGGGNAIHFHSGPSIQAEATHLTFSAPARFDEGIAYVPAMGDLSMGVYTNCP